MVTIHFKLSELGEVTLPVRPGQTLAELLATGGLTVGAADCLAIRRGVVIQPTTAVEDGDVIIMVPAIAGG